MNGCRSCGGFGGHHDRIVHGWELDNGPVIEVGTPVYGETTEGEPITLWVTHVTEDGTIMIGPEEP